jgi:hypothetical protein
MSVPVARAKDALETWNYLQDRKQYRPSSYEQHLMVHETESEVVDAQGLSMRGLGAGRKALDALLSVVDLVQHEREVCEVRPGKTTSSTIH